MSINVFGAKDGTTVVKSSKAKLTVSGYGKGGGGDMIALDVSIQYGREVQNVPVIGPKRILSIGEATGTCTINSLLVKDSGSAASAFESLLGGKEDCSPCAITLDLSQEDTCKTMKGIRVVMRGCIASAVNITAQGGRGYVANGVTITFTDLDIDDGQSVNNSSSGGGGGSTLV